MDKYMLNLYIQYCHSSGMQYDGKIDDRGFKQWLKEYRKTLDDFKKYIELLRKLFHEEDNIFLEVDKGTFDTLNLYNSIVVSNYTSSINVQPQRFRVQDCGIPILEGENIDDNSIFYTYNPYNMNLVKNWEQIHNRGGYSILFGVCGKNYDEDSEFKKSKFHDFSGRIKKNQKVVECITENDNYYYLVKSDYTRKW